MITAKPVVANKFWILKQDNQKVGTVEHNRDGFVVRINNEAERYPSIRTLKNRTNISFEESQKRKTSPEFEVNGFPTDSKPFNGVYNVKQRLPLFTKKNKSKSWYAAGYYQITINGQTEVHFCPKLIMLQRYDFLGPVREKDGFTFK